MFGSQQSPTPEVTVSFEQSNSYKPSDYLLHPSQGEVKCTLQLWGLLQKNSQPGVSHPAAIFVCLFNGPHEKPTEQKGNRMAQGYCLLQQQRAIYVNGSSRQLRWKADLSRL